MTIVGSIVWLDNNANGMLTLYMTWKYMILPKREGKAIKVLTFSLVNGMKGPVRSHRSQCVRNMANIVGELPRNLFLWSSF